VAGPRGKRRLRADQVAAALPGWPMIPRLWASALLDELRELGYRVVVSET